MHHWLQEVGFIEFIVTNVLVWLTLFLREKYEFLWYFFIYLVIRDGFLFQQYFISIRFFKYIYFDFIQKNMDIKH